METRRRLKQKAIRIVTPTQNGYNKGIQPYNTSGEIGVYFNKRKKKWVAQIIYDGKHYCAYYNSKEEAIVGRRKLENDLLGNIATIILLISIQNKINRRLS